MVLRTVSAPAPAVAESDAPIASPITSTASECDAPDEISDGIIAILDQPHVGSIAASYQIKEAALFALFESLSPDDARRVEDRLRNPKEGDVLAAKFQRLVAERRTRLITYLADARRRAARSPSQK